MTTGYYPGCALHGSAGEYEKSILRISERLGWDIREIGEWNCCGGSAGHMTDHSLATAISARNLVLAREQGFQEVLVPCPMCSGMLLSARHELTGDPDLWQQLGGSSAKPLEDQVEILNLIQMIQRTGLEVLAEKVSRPLAGIRVACYYGCLLVRPPKLVQFDDPEDPVSMEEILQALGADTVSWPLRTNCCGAGFTLSSRQSVLRLTGDILKSAHRAGAELIVTACPMCHANLDMMQHQVEKSHGTPLGIPILYLSQAVGLALGLTPEELGIGQHFVPMPEITEPSATVEAASASRKE